MRCKNGSTKDVMINSSPLVIDGKFICTRSSMRDVTAQWSIEGHLRGEAEKWEILHRTGVTLTSQLELQQIVQTVTDAAVQLTGAEFGAFFYNVEKPEGGEFMLYTLSGAPREAFANFPMPRATAMFGPTFRGERIVRIDDVLAHPDYGKIRAAPRHAEGPPARAQLSRRAGRIAPGRGATAACSSDTPRPACSRIATS